ncbi:SDR family oxidoreductase [Klebsiella aerogenes]|uniref:SDR family oxidoreductase n=1 Tax=Klebsiella aerogenes TaxID=548 RepID=UPI001C22E4C0|nr:SDR family oxidoreductase [Klebsiella aerogenes]QXA74094.1 SDR family oxidoreductase [Klebsiella aerogenes]
MGKLDGKVAVITGGSDGIGLAAAQLFSQEGATVVITGRDQARLGSAGQHGGGKIDAVRSDISVMTDIEQLCAYVKTRYGHVDILFANAGVGRPRLFAQVTEEDFDFTVNTNFKGTFFTVQKITPLMASGSSVILTTSTLDQQGRPYVSVYSATKAAIRSLARSLAAELSDAGIRVNALSPGLIDTDQARKVGMSEEMIKQSNAHLHTLIPMHRSGTADEIARAALFLASDDSSYVTGSELCVDGGWAQV